jgi:hypothetical protein
MKRKAMWKLEKKLARKKRRTKKREVLYLIVVVKELLSHSSMTRCFGMCSHRLSPNLQQEISVPLQGIFSYDVTMPMHMHVTLKMCYSDSFLCAQE